MDICKNEVPHLKTVDNTIKEENRSGRDAENSEHEHFAACHLHSL
jgi:hypothetical protein